jgi:hypothetical protein
LKPSSQEYRRRTARTLSRAIPLGKKGPALMKSRIREFISKVMKD